MERRKTPAGREYDAWMLDGMQVGTLGAVMQAGQRFEDPSQIDFLGALGGRPQGRLRRRCDVRRERGGRASGARCCSLSQGLFWYRIPDSELLTGDLPRLQRLDRRFLQAAPAPAEGHRDAQCRRPRCRREGARALRQDGPCRLVHPGLAACRTSPTAVPFTTVSGRRRRTSITRC